MSSLSVNLLVILGNTSADTDVVVFVVWITVVELVVVVVVGNEELVRKIVKLVNFGNFLKSSTVKFSKWA